MANREQKLEKRFSVCLPSLSVLLRELVVYEVAFPRNCCPLILCSWYRSPKKSSRGMTGILQWLTTHFARVSWFREPDVPTAKLCYFAETSAVLQNGKEV